MKMKLLLVTVFSFITMNLVYGQNAEFLKTIEKNINKVEKINALNGIMPNSASQKTTSTDRRIKTAVIYIGQEYDSIVYTNVFGAYSELSSLGFSYRRPFPVDDELYPLEVSTFAAQSSIRFAADSSQVYSVADSSSYVYNANGDLETYYVANDSLASTTNYNYNSSYQLMTTVTEVKNTFGTIVYQNIDSYRYGSNYIVAEYDSVTTDSAIYDANGRVWELYSAPYSIKSVYTYDTDGYLDTVSLYMGTDLAFMSIMTYVPNYKQYTYVVDFYNNGSVGLTQNRVLVGQSGKLDSAYFSSFDSSGNFLESFEYSDVEMDSYGNITSAVTYADDGSIDQTYTYYYEDVETGIDEPSRSFADYKIFPNPSAQEYITINASENFSSIRVHTIEGQLILQTNFSPRTEAQLSTENLTPGSYIVTFSSEDGLQSSEVVVKR